MMNFDFKHLYLINPPQLNEECYTRAMHAKKILDNAKSYTTLSDAIKNLDYLVATSSVDTKSDKKHLRNPLSLDKFTTVIYETEGNIGLLFGREDNGLLNQEISQCDIMVKIPTSETYPTMNLSHAVSIILYSLYIKKQTQEKPRRDINTNEKEKLYQFFSILLDNINYQDHKKENTKIMFKRLMGRAIPSKWEYHTLMGVFTKTIQTIQYKKR